MYPDVQIFLCGWTWVSYGENIKVPEKIPFQVDILVNNAGLVPDGIGGYGPDRGCHDGGEHEYHGRRRV